MMATVYVFNIYELICLCLGFSALGFLLGIGAKMGIDEIVKHRKGGGSN